MERFRQIKDLGKKAANSIVNTKAGRIAFSALLMAVIVDGDASADSVISASPNPIPAGTTGPGATEISWNTGNPAGEVMLSVNGASEVLFNRGVSGLDRPNWFNAGNRYDFNVYADSSHTNKSDPSHANKLGSTRVLRSVTSQPLSVTPEAGNPDLYTLSFNGNGISDTMQVWVAVNNGPESLVVQNPHYTWTGINWIQPGNTYTFTEYAGQGKIPEGIVNKIDVVKGAVATPIPTPIPENCPNPINGNFYRVRACFTDSFGTRRLFGVDLAGDGTANAAIYNWNRDNNTFTNRIPVNAALNPDSDGIAIAGIVVDTAFDRTYLLEGADRPPFTNIYMARLEYFNTTHAITNPTDLSSHSVANSGLPQGGINGIPDGFTLTENSDSNGKYLRANIVNSVTSSENGSYDSRLTSGTGIPGTWSRVSTSSLSSEAKITLTPTRTATPKPTTTISFPNSVTGRRESFTVTPTPRGTVAIS